MVTDDWQDGRHLDHICNVLEDIAERKLRRVIINIPPGYAKSWLCSRCFPAWYLMHYPKREVMLVSYGDDLAEEHSAAARQFFSFWAPQIVGSGLAKDSKSVRRWVAEIDAQHRGGGMRACGVGSSVTGRRADVIIVDDPFKNWEDASSESARERVWTFYQSVLRSRLRPGGCIIVIQTRWHDDDLTGRLLAAMDKGSMPWEIVKLGAVAEENDPLGREVGEPLWPEMYDKQELDEIKSDVGEFFWDTQFQQNPKDPEGKMIKKDWFRDFWIEDDYVVLDSKAGEVRYHKSDIVTIQAVDPAATENEKNDEFCDSTWSICPRGEILLRHVYLDRIATTDHVDTVIEQFDMWMPDYICLSKKSYGLNIFEELELLGYPLEEISEDNSKLARSLPIIRQYKKGNVYHLRDAEWRSKVEKQLKEFPGGTHDDFVDTASAIGIQSIQLGGLLTEIPTVGGAKRGGDKAWFTDSEIRQEPAGVGGRPR